MANFKKSAAEDKTLDMVVKEEKPKNSLLESATLLTPTTKKEHGALDAASDSRNEVKCNGNNINSKATPQSEIEWFPFFLINVSAASYACKSRIQDALINQYIYHAYAKSILGNGSMKYNTDTANNPCLGHNDSLYNESTTGLHMQVRKIQDKTSQLILQLDMMTYGIVLVSIPVLGILSTHLSRRTQLLIPTVGALIKCIIIALVVNFDGDLSWLYLGVVVGSITGDRFGTYMGFWLYASDVTPRNHKRTVSMAVLESLRGVTGSSMNVVAGIMMTQTGFLLPAYICCAAVFISISVIFLLPDKKPEVQESWSTKQAARNLMFPLLSKQDVKVKAMLILIFLGYFLCFVERIGTAKILGLYVMNFPFCWSATKIGWYNFVKEMAFQTCAMLAIPLIYRCFPGVTLGILGSLGNILECVMCAVAQTDTGMYIAAAVSLLRAFPSAIMRGEASILLGSHHQGSLFSKIMLLEILGCCGGSLFILAYKQSLYTSRALPFVLMASLMLIVTVVLSICQVIWRKCKVSNYEELPSSH